MFPPVHEPGRPCVKEAELIAIFTLLGLGLFGGGAYAVYDGWPYLVLERGFTQVIIGSIAMTAGLILLALAWVLKQLKAIRTELAEAAEARVSVTAPAEAAFPAVLPMAPANVPPASSPIVPAVLGAGAAAAAAAVVAETSEASPSTTGAVERDLFGTLVADHLAAAPKEEEGEEEQDEVPAPERDDSVLDMFAKVAADIEPSEAEHPIAVEDESHEPAEIVAAHIQPLSEDEALAHSDEQAEAAVEKAEIDELPPEHPVAAVTDQAPADEEDSARDEFAMLRESLTTELGDLRRPAGRVEPSFALDDPFAEAETWMKPGAKRQEPRFDTERPSAEVEETQKPMPVAPVWPPRTGPHAFGVSPANEAEQPAKLSPEPVGMDAAPEAPVPSEEVAEAPSKPADEEVPAGESSPAVSSEPAAPEPAASEEGVVGAYQVGEAHFTIYADGSIRARTPDGEYSFASMDELKVYLASEKSRLGV